MTRAAEKIALSPIPEHRQPIELPCAGSLATLEPNEVELHRAPLANTEARIKLFCTWQYR